jgi:hypothetical protein
MEEKDSEFARNWQFGGINTAQAAMILRAKMSAAVGQRSRSEIV